MGKDKLDNYCLIYGQMRIHRYQVRIKMKRDLITLPHVMNWIHSCSLKIRVKTFKITCSDLCLECNSGQHLALTESKIYYSFFIFLVRASIIEYQRLGGL